jgi:hypothetical protein
MFNDFQFRPGPNRVAAWVYTVINPLIEALQQELFLLEKETFPGVIILSASNLLGR